MKVNNTAALLLCVVIVGIASTNGSWICTSSWLKVFSRQGSSSVIPFRINVPSPSPLPATVQIKKINEIVAAVFYADPPWTSSKLGYTLIVDAGKGELNLTIENVTAGHAVSYVAINAEKQTDAVSCATLYVLGVPSSPAISVDKIPSVEESVTVTCSSISTTTPSNHSLSLRYDWIVNESLNPSDPKYSYSASRNTITLSSVTKHDAGKQFTCTATEGVTNGYTSNRSNVVVITVHYGPEDMTVVPSSISYLKEENTDLPPITCSAECYPACSFQWTKQNSLVSSNKQLQLGSLEASEAGLYTCTATRPGSASSQHLELTVNVIYGPYQESTTLSSAQTEYTMNEKEVLPDITCNADCYPYCNYTWTKQSDASPIVVSRTAVLSLGKVLRTDAAKYVCSAVNLHKKENDTTSTEVQIKVNYGPDRPCDNVSSVQTFTEGDSTASIRCFSECYPGCSYTWSNGRGFLNRSETLSFASVRRYHAGNYTFRAENLANSNSAQKIFNLTILYAPVVSIELSTSDHSEYTTLTLYCKGEGVPANYTYTGLTQAVGEVEIPNLNSALRGTEMNSSIHFPSLQRQDTGKYTCKMNNGILDLHGTLEQTMSVELLVEVRPHILVSGLKYTGAQGNSTTVHIPFYCYPPVQSVTFVRHDGTPITNGTKYRTFLIHSDVQDTFYSRKVTLNGYQIVWEINDLTEEDFVSYTLTILNSRGNTSELVIIMAESIPSIPISFIFASYGFILMWEKNFNGGHPQTFIVEVSIDGRKEWHTMSSISENDKDRQVNNNFYIIKIEGLDPGTYTARLIARNSIGETAPLYLNATFTIPPEESKSVTDGLEAVSSGTLAGGISGGFIAGVLVTTFIFVFIIMRRRGLLCKDKRNSTLPDESSSPHYESLGSHEQVNAPATYSSLTLAQQKDEPKKHHERNDGDRAYVNIKLTAI